MASLQPVNLHKCNRSVCTSVHGPMHVCLLHCSPPHLCVKHSDRGVGCSTQQVAALHGIKVQPSDRASMDLQAPRKNGCVAGGSITCLACTSGIVASIRATHAAEMLLCVPNVAFSGPLVPRLTAPISRHVIAGAQLHIPSSKVESTPLFTS
jgi:hypothetical protein